MKKYFLLILISNVLSLVSFAQVYEPFPVSNARWSEKVELAGNDIFFPATGYGWCYALANDTLIGTYHYTLLGGQQTWDYQGWNHVGDTILSDFQSNNYGFNSPGQIFGAIREDSNKKVWFRKFASNSFIGGSCFYLDDFPVDSDILLYDFDLQVGDSLPWTYWYWWGMKHVMNIDSIQYDDGIWRKRFRMWPIGEYWIEGIGSTQGLFGSLTYPNFPCLLSCFWINGQRDIIAPPSLYDFCDSVISAVGIENVFTSSASLSLTPNPATTQLEITFQSTTQPQHLTLINTLGQTIQQQTFYTNQLQLDISTLPSGVYFIELQNEKQERLKSL